MRSYMSVCTQYRALLLKYALEGSFIIPKKKNLPEMRIRKRAEKKLNLFGDNAAKKKD